MNRLQFRKVTTIVLTGFFLYGPCRVARAEPLNKDNFRQFLESVRQKYDLPALGAAVINGDNITVATTGVRKYGDPTPVTDEDEFHLGSNTKSMTATLMAMLVEDGTVKWDTTLETVFPELAGSMQPAYRKVTVEQLLQHRAGIVPKNVWPPGSSNRTWKNRTDPIMEQRLDFVSQILKMPPAAPPGTKFIYSNAGYMVAGAMMERVTGKSWEDLITQRLFQPLGMTTAGFGGAATPGLIDQPWGHWMRHGTWMPVPGGMNADNPPVMGPASTVHCSLGDWAKYARFHLNGFRNGSPLLNPGSFQKLYAPPSGGSYAMGWWVLKRDWGGGIMLMHTGMNGMNNCLVWLAPLRDFGVVVATNCNTGTEPNLHKEHQALDEVADAVTKLLGAR